MSKELKCAHCGFDIFNHVPVTWMSCLAALSGEITVYREKIEEDKAAK